MFLPWLKYRSCPVRRLVAAQLSTAAPPRVVLNVGVLALVGALLAAVAFSNEPYLVAT